VSGSKCVSGKDAKDGELREEAAVHSPCQALAHRPIVRRTATHGTHEASKECKADTEMEARSDKRESEGGRR
jgi:hypothetical protein